VSTTKGHIHGKREEDRPSTLFIFFSDDTTQTLSS
jgi:hypothetical protein